MAALDNIVIKPQGTNWNNIVEITPTSLISGAITLVLTLAAIGFLAMLLAGGLKWVVSEGEKTNVEAARNQVTNAVVGLVIVFSAFAAVKLIETLFGVTIIGGAISIPKLFP